MSSAALRLRLWLIAAPVAHGCSSSSPSPATPTSSPVVVSLASAGPARSSEVPYTPLRPTASASVAPGPLAWVAGDALCARAAHTNLDTLQDSETRAFGCGDGLDDEALQAAQSTPQACSYCYFSFARLTTEHERGEHPDACCYDVLRVLRGRPLVVEATEREARLVRGRSSWSA